MITGSSFQNSALLHTDLPVVRPGYNDEYDGTTYKTTMQKSEPQRKKKEIDEMTQTAKTQQKHGSNKF